MRRVACLLASCAGLAVLAALLPGGSFRAETKAATKTVKAFSLKDSAGHTWSLAGQKDKKSVVVLFVGTECPVNNQYLPRLAELYKAYSPQGVAFVGINSNVHDTPTRIAAHVQAHGIPFPVLKDPANMVADDFGARRTPEAFILTPAGKVLYQGRIDDQIGIGFKRKEPMRRDLAVALDEVLAGKPVSQSLTAVAGAGCLIARTIKPRETGSITFTKDVSRILQNRCQECHRAGEVAPMPLMSYEDALSWQEMIQEVIEERRMPPWHAEASHGKFSNDRSLTKQERDTLLGWIKQGCPKGDPKDLPPPRQFARGWTIGTPDLVVQMPREVTVPAKTGPRGIAYQYYRVPTNFAEDRWIQAAEARPGAREVVHHIIVYIMDPARIDAQGPRDARGPGNPFARSDGIGNGLLVAYAPGDMPLKLEPGQAKKLPKGALLVFQMHYTPDGVERKDRSSVGLVFAKKPPRVEVRTRGVTQRLFMIPPGAKSHEVTSRSTFETDVELLSFMPHMHLRGKDFKYTAVFPDGKKEPLLSVPRYDFNWQSTYRLTEALKLPKGTRIECVAHFDNSSENPNNPDPKKSVIWGEQTWEEMMIGFVDYAVPVEKGEK